MGDLRNKFLKDQRAARHREWMAKYEPPRPPPPPLACCLCEWEIFSRPPASREPLRLVQIAMPRHGWHHSATFCTRCLPMAPGYEPGWDAMVGIIG